jgi:hypothetical protein
MTSGIVIKLLGGLMVTVVGLILISTGISWLLNTFAFEKQKDQFRDLLRQMNYEMRDPQPDREVSFTTSDNYGLVYDKVQDRINPFTYLSENKVRRWGRDQLCLENCLCIFDKRKGEVLLCVSLDFDLEIEKDAGLDIKDIGTNIPWVKTAGEVKFRCQDEGWTLPYCLYGAKATPYAAERWFKSPDPARKKAFTYVFGVKKDNNKIVLTVKEAYPLYGMGGFWSG